jgi:hypothetical protein
MVPNDGEFMFFLHHPLKTSLIAGWLLFTMASISGIAQASYGAVAAGQGVFLGADRIKELQTRVASHTEPNYSAYLEMKSLADASLEREPHTPKDGRWQVPGFYQDTVGHRAAKNGLRDDANLAYALALTYRMTGDPAYAVAAARLVRAWTKVTQLEAGDDSSLTFSYHFPALIFAADLLRGSEAWSAEDEIQFQHYLNLVKTELRTWPVWHRDNNWGNWGLVLGFAIAAYNGDQQLFDEATHRWMELIPIQMDDRGHLVKEVRRNQGRGEHGIWYSHFTIGADVIAAEIARINGVDLFDYTSKDGRKLQTAFDTLAGWVRNPASFPYYTGDLSKLHAINYVGYYEILSGRWSNPDAAASLAAERPTHMEHGAPYLSFTHADIPVEAQAPPDPLP